MPWTIAAIDPLSGSRELLVEVHPEIGEITDATLHAFAEKLFRRNVRVGLVMTPAQTVVLRDTLSSMQFAVSAMVPDVVGNLAGATLETWDGLLASHDAAE